MKKTLKSAIANAENNNSLKVDTLLVKEAVVGEGPTSKRFRARARGSASPLRKRTSHIRIILSDDVGSDGKQKPAQDAVDVASPESAAEGKAKTRQRKPSTARSRSKREPQAQAKRSTEKAGTKAEKKATNKKD